MLVVIRTLTKVSKRLGKRLEELENKGKFGTIQTTVLPKVTRILNTKKCVRVLRKFAVT